MIASTFFIAASGASATRTLRLLEPLAACKAGSASLHRLHRSARAMRRGLGAECLVAAAPVAAHREHVRVLAVLREVEPRELVVFADAQAAGHRTRDAETDERPDDGEHI